MTIWLSETCPGCKAVNFWSDDPDDGDCSKMDVGTIKCHGCGKDFRLFDDEFGETFRPHMDGDSKWDEFDGGAYRDGQAAPS